VVQVCAVGDRWRRVVVMGFCGGCEIVCRRVVWFSRLRRILGLSLRHWRTLRVRFRGKKDCVKTFFKCLFLQMKTQIRQIL